MLFVFYLSHLLFVPFFFFYAFSQIEHFYNSTLYSLLAYWLKLFLRYFGCCFRVYNIHFQFITLSSLYYFIYTIKTFQQYTCISPVPASVLSLLSYIINSVTHHVVLNSYLLKSSIYSCNYHPQYSPFFYVNPVSEKASFGHLLQFLSFGAKFFPFCVS